MSKPNIESLLTQKEVCRLLHVTTETLRKYRVHGVNGRKLKALRLGGKRGRILYERDEVLSFLRPANECEPEKVTSVDLEVRALLREKYGI